MAVEVGEAALVHPAVILGFAVFFAAGCHRLVDDGVDFLPAFDIEGDEHFGCLRGVGDLLLGESLKLGVREEHRKNVLADDHARGRVIGELRVEREPELGEERDRCLQVFDGEIDEDLGGHSEGSVAKRILSVFQQAHFVTGVIVFVRIVI